MNKIWSDELQTPVIITDENLILNYMNPAAISQFADDGGESLIGSSLPACHNEESNKIIQDIIATGKPNIYTIQKKGKKKLIYQAPLYNDGVFSGLVEISFIIPEEMPHFNRDTSE